MINTYVYIQVCTVVKDIPARMRTYPRGLEGRSRGGEGKRPGLHLASARKEEKEIAR